MAPRREYVSLESGKGRAKRRARISAYECGGVFVARCPGPLLTAA